MHIETFEFTGYNGAQLAAVIWRPEKEGGCAEKARKIIGEWMK